MDVSRGDHAWQTATFLPPGVAKRWPAGWKAVFVIHYSPNGSPQVDQTRLGLVFADPAAVHKEVYTHLTADVALAIPPRASDHQVTHKFVCPDDMHLYAIFPHMHVRGKSFQAVAKYPDGREEILLDVPHYDFAWQHQYVLAEPIRLPSGTVLEYTIAYDNSKENLANPNPDVWVHTGPESWDEMFNAYVDIAFANQDLQVDGRRLMMKRAGAAALLAGCLPLVLWRWRNKARRAASHRQA